MQNVFGDTQTMPALNLVAQQQQQQPRRVFGSVRRRAMPIGGGMGWGGEMQQERSFEPVVQHAELMWIFIPDMD